MGSSFISMYIWTERVVVSLIHLNFYRFFNLKKQKSYFTYLFIYIFLWYSRTKTNHLEGEILCLTYIFPDLWISEIRFIMRNILRKITNLRFIFYHLRKNNAKIVITYFSVTFPLWDHDSPNWDSIYFLLQ